MRYYRAKTTFGIGSPSLIIDKSNNKDIKLLSAVFQASPLVLLALKDSNINSIKDFKGKRIMATPNAYTSASLRAMMSKNKINYDALIHKKHSFDLNDLIDKKIDLMGSYISNEPYRLAKKNIGYTIFDPKDYGFDLYSDILFTSTHETRNDPQKVLSFVKASMRGWRYAFEHIDESVDIILSKYNSQNKTKNELVYEAKELKKLAFYDTDEIGHIDINKIKRIYDMYNIMGFIKNKIDFEDFIFHYCSFQKLNLTQKELNYLKKHPLLKIHNENSWPPFNYNENGIPKGFAIDYIKLLAKKIDINLKFISGYTWSQFMDMLQGNELDLIINMVKTEQRAKTIAFSDPYYKTQNVIYVHKNNQNFESLKDLDYQSIAIVKDFFTQKYIKEHYPKIKQTLVKNQLEALKLLSLGKVDAVIGKKVVIDRLIRNNSISSVTPSKYIEDENLISTLRIGAAKKDSILIDIIKKAQKSISPGEIRELNQKWFGVKEPRKNTLSKEQKEYIRTKKSINVCIDNIQTPVRFEKSDLLLGISGDILNLIGKKNTLELKYINTKNRAHSYQLLENKRCDIIPNVIKNDEIKTPVYFTKPYLNYDTAIITAKNRPLVAGLGSLSDKQMVMEKNNHLLPSLKKKYKNLKIIYTNSRKKSLEMIEKNKAYFTVCPLAIYSYNKNKYRFNNLQIAGYTDIKYKSVMAVRGDEPVLFSIINDTLNNITDDTLNIIYEKWVNQERIKEVDYELVGKLFSLFLFILLIIIFFMLKQNKLKQLIQDQKETFEKLYLKSADGIILQENGKIIDCNESILKMLGFDTKEDLLSIPPSTIYPEFQPDGSKSGAKIKKMENIAFYKGSNSYEFLYTRSNGKRLWAEVVITKISISKKDIFHVVIRDIEDRKKAEEQLSLLNRNLKEQVNIEVEKNRKKDEKMLEQSRLAQMGEMISMIAHQWRQPLAAIGSTAINMKFKLELESFDLTKEYDRKKCEEFFIKELNDIEKYVQNLTTTIDDFRNFYKPNKEVKKVSIEEPLQKALGIIKNSFESQNVTITKILKTKKEIHVYESELMQVFLNILQNSLDSFKGVRDDRDKRIDILLEDKKEGIKVTFSDNASGIPESIINNIFDPYFSTKNKKNGTGLGLYMSKTIIEKHHKGKINVYNNTGENMGACFEITIKDLVPN